MRYEEDVDMCRDKGVLTTTGRDGQAAVAFTCPSPAEAVLTFEFRKHSEGKQPGAIAPGHKGPCAVYLKRMDDMYADSATGPGWFKIWQDGYSTTSEQWCVDRLIDNDGLLSVKLPHGLPAGYYLVRPEVLALHNAVNGDPQFYVGCGQIYLEGPAKALSLPSESTVNIPGYVDGDTPGVKFNIYDKPLPEYSVPGPRVYEPPADSGSVKLASAENGQEKGLVPKDCILRNANWCARPLHRYSTVQGCRSAVEECYKQGQRCWDEAPPSGGDENCGTWQSYCEKTDRACDAGDFQGPGEFQGRQALGPVPGVIPVPY